MQIRDNTETYYRRENQELKEKTLRDSPSRNDPLVNKLKYKDTKKTLQA